MVKFTETEIKSLVEIKNSEEYIRRFNLAKGNVFKISKIWGMLLDELKFECTSNELREINDSLKTFRKKKLEAGTSGSGSIR